MSTSRRLHARSGPAATTRSGGGVRDREPHAGRPSGDRPAGPVPGSVLDLLRRSDEELVAAQLSTDPVEQFRHAHLAAIRAGAAVAQSVPGRGPRSRPRPVWELVAAAAPGLTGWASWFADNAVLRAAVEAGRVDAVTSERAGRTLAAAEDFQDAVRAWWGLAGEDGGVPEALRAS